MRRWIAATLISLGTAFGLTLAQDQAVQQDAIDRPFLQAAAQGDMYEIASSELAQDRAANEDVQAFAQRMIEDHTMTTERITELAGTIGVELPTTPAPAHLAKIVQLRQVENGDFDRVYMQQQVLAHRDAVSLFEAAAMHAENDDVRSAVEELLPDLQEHLEMAQDLVDQLE